MVPPCRNFARVEIAAGIFPIDVPLAERRIMAEGEMLRIICDTMSELNTSPAFGTVVNCLRFMGTGETAFSEPACGSCSPS